MDEFLRELRKMITIAGGVGVGCFIAAAIFVALFLIIVWLW